MNERKVVCRYTEWLFKALLIVFLGIWLSQTAQAQSPCTVTQITERSSTVVNSAPSINSDGTRIAFVSNAGGNNEIMLFDAITGITQITRTNVPLHNENPSINSDGTRIAFQSSTFSGNGSNFDFEIFLFDATTGIRQITRPFGNVNGNRNPSINSDGTRIAFEGFGDSDNFQILLASQRTITRITPTPPNAPNARNFNPSINSDGTRIAFTSDADGNFEIYLYDATTGIRQITRTNSNVTNSFPSISSDGIRIAFVSNVDGNDEIFLADTSASSPTITQITHTPASFTSGGPSISSDGRRIAFVSNGDITGTGENRDGNFEIFLADITTSPPTFTQVTHTSGFLPGTNILAFNAHPSINSDGTAIAFESNSAGTSPVVSYGIFIARCGVTPLVFIPGIAGSRLDEVGGGNIWPSKILAHLLPEWVISA